MSAAKVVLVFGLLFAATSAYAGEPSLPERSAKASGRDIELPRKLIDKIENDHRAFLKTAGLPNETFKRQMLNMSIELTQERPIALNEAARVVTPLGGGVVDLADYVTPLRGSFHLKLVPANQDGSWPAAMRVFFVSRAKARILAGEKYGAGCGKFMDITSFFNKSSGKGGFELFTADQRYLSVVGGSFVVAASDKDALSVASVNFTDSRYTDLLCE